MLHCEIVLFFIFAYKQKAPSFAEIRRMSLGFISTQPFTTKPAERGSKAHSPVFAWCLFGVYYYSEILSAVPTYPPKTA